MGLNINITKEVIIQHTYVIKMGNSKVAGIALLQAEIIQYALLPVGLL